MEPTGVVRPTPGDRKAEEPVSAIDSHDFRIGRVLGRCFSILFRDSLALTGLTIAFYVVLALTMALLFLVALLFVGDPGEILRQITQGGGQAQSIPIDPDAEAPMVILFIVWIPFFIFVYGLFYAFIIERAMQKSLGVSAGFRETFRRSIRAALPLVGVGFIATILFYLGLVLLIIPGIFVAIILCLSPAATVVERAGVFGGLARSAELTKGQRWRIFALLVIFLLVSTIPPYVVLFLFGAVGALLGPIGLGILSFIGALIATVYGAVLPPLYLTVMYHDLRLAKEGWSPESIAAVFD